jgi:hypothetical protein
MKKQYISPEAVCNQMVLEGLLNVATITGVDNTDVDHEIEMGGEAVEGLTSDSRRRRNFWDDEEFDDYDEF